MSSLLSRPLRLIVVVAFIASVISIAATAAVSRHLKGEPALPQVVVEMPVSAASSDRLRRRQIDTFTVHVDAMMPGEYMVAITRGERVIRYRGKHPDATPLVVTLGDDGQYVATHKPKSESRADASTQSVVEFSKYMVAKVIQIGGRIVESENRVFMR